jgi:hypothetical protein
MARAWEMAEKIAALPALPSWVTKESGGQWANILVQQPINKLKSSRQQSGLNRSANLAPSTCSPTHDM